ncbi:MULTISPECIES: TOPRIM nucleotidyl transferase/hydrolase domain-containing protein [unclassified Bradyrhizobium]|uniref:TOPRIM nucleotidyl transferase/hydrolase domain-containing protein n=1 Tax=unclassified Bradyrhizobium TaxID=2631580 RepID=UPI0028E86118|nr:MULTISPECIES: TOPRIM nucleotidyl transferase/hydrolase domain-containing protein [unclassified Bradyrhizobium]
MASRLEVAYGKAPGTFTAASLKARLHIINSEIAEGFFAGAVVLVEGVSDRAAIIAAAALEGIDLEALGIAILPVDGKTNLDRPLAIFKELKIPTFAVWDCDKGDHQDQNRALQILSGVDAGSVFSPATVVADSYACFENVLEDVLKAEMGNQTYQEELGAVKLRYGLVKNEDAIKVPAIMIEVLTTAAKKGAKSAILAGIVSRVVSLRTKSRSETGAKVDESHVDAFLDA